MSSIYPSVRALLTICLASVPAAVLAAGTPSSATVTLQSAKGAAVGEAVLTRRRRLPRDVHDLPPGEHAFRIHEHGRCEAPFESAGGRFNPRARTTAS
jgi:Cu-Zn family superoxide dismutase